MQVAFADHGLHRGWGYRNHYPALPTAGLPRGLPWPRFRRLLRCRPCSKDIKTKGGLQIWVLPNLGWCSSYYIRYSYYTIHFFTIDCDGKLLMDISQEAVLRILKALYFFLGLSLARVKADAVALCLVSTNEETLLVSAGFF